MQPRQTHHHLDFDAAELAARRRDLGLTVSVIIPARNEAATVGNVVRAIRTSCVERHDLVDEVVVVDGESVDGTWDLAKAAGARMVQCDEVLTSAGPGQGKGDALWKGLASTDGDLVCFVDADIFDIDERFVVGLLGPLLHDESVLFTKACYDRPLKVGKDVLPTGGGRVTELLARPLINAFWPELSFLAQPLSGEYAGRRPILESLPFVQGYGVELGLLVDLLAAHGSSSIAQVDLGTREHQNQPLAALGRMAAEILAVAMQRLTRQDKLVLTDPINKILQQTARSDGKMVLVDHPVRPSERPALATFRDRGDVTPHR